MNAFGIRLDVGEEELTFVTRKSPAQRYVPVGDILESDNLYAFAQKLVDSGQAFTKDVGALANHLQGVTRIKQAILPTVQIDDTIELTEVAEIFKRLNSTGTRVQQADIYLGVVASRNPGWVNQTSSSLLMNLTIRSLRLNPLFCFGPSLGLALGKAGSAIFLRTFGRTLTIVKHGIRPKGPCGRCVRAFGSMES